MGCIGSYIAPSKGIIITETWSGLKLETHGFISGVFHGLTWLFALIGMMFNSDIGMWAYSNTGFTYWLGFFIGCAIQYGIYRLFAIEVFDCNSSLYNLKDKVVLLIVPFFVYSTLLSTILLYYHYFDTVDKQKDNISKVINGKSIDYKVDCYLLLRHQYPCFDELYIDSVIPDIMECNRNYISNIYKRTKDAPGGKIINTPKVLYYIFNAPIIDTVHDYYTMREDFSNLDEVYVDSVCSMDRIYELLDSPFDNLWSVKKLASNTPLQELILPWYEDAKDVYFEEACESTELIADEMISYFSQEYVHLIEASIDSITTANALESINDYCGGIANWRKMKMLWNNKQDCFEKFKKATKDNFSPEKYYNCVYEYCEEYITLYKSVLYEQFVTLENDNSSNSSYRFTLPDLTIKGLDLNTIRNDFYEITEEERGEVVHETVRETAEVGVQVGCWILDYATYGLSTPITIPVRGAIDIMDVGEIINEVVEASSDSELPLDYEEKLQLLLNGTIEVDLSDPNIAKAMAQTINIIRETLLNQLKEAL